MESATDLDTRLTGCFQRVFPTLGPDLVGAAGPDAIAEWDSLASISLVQVIEEEFDVPVDFEELSKLGSFQAVSQYMQALLARDQRSLARDQRSLTRDQRSLTRDQRSLTRD